VTLCASRWCLADRINRGSFSAGFLLLLWQAPARLCATSSVDKALPSKP